MRLCPRFLSYELEIRNYDNDYKLLDVPAFKNQIRKIPQDEQKQNRIDLIKASIRALEEKLKPTGVDEMTEQLGKLMLHKGFGNYSEGQWTAVLGDYIRLLGSYPYDLICKACDDCILDEHMEYFPQVGRLKAKMMRELTLRCLYLERLRKVLAQSEVVIEREPERNKFAMDLANKFKM